MPCRRCSGQPQTPWVRPGMPTVLAWGPFPGHEPVVYEPAQEEESSE